MSFRVTPHRQYELGQARSQTHYARGARIQEQVSSGFRINRPSDDPSGQKIVLNQTSLIQRFTTQISSIETTRSILTDAQTQVLDAQQLMVQAKSIALQARQTTEPSERDVFVQQLDSILQRLDSIANAQSNGQYLFAGTHAGTAPFTGIKEGEVAYHGSQEAARTHLTGVASFKTYYSGANVFGLGGGGGLVISGITGIASGAGTSSAMTTTLTIRHQLTTYEAGSGVQAGTSSGSGDTVLGPLGTHTLTIHDTSGDGSAGTVSLNGGEPIAFTSSDADLLVTGPDGERVYINTQSIASGFSGTVNITATGTLSIDGGATEVPIDFSSNQVVTSSQSSAVQFFDTTQLSSTGTVQVSPESTTDVFQVVRNLRDTILNTANLTPAELDEAFNRSLADTERAENRLLSVIGEQSADMEHLDILQRRIETLEINATTLLTKVHGTDYASAITQLQEQQTLLQFTLQTLMVMNSISMVDFL